MSQNLKVLLICPHREIQAAIKERLTALMSEWFPNIGVRWRVESDALDELFRNPCRVPENIVILWTPLEKPTADGKTVVFEVISNHRSVNRVSFMPPVFGIATLPGIFAPLFGQLDENQSLVGMRNIIKKVLEKQ